MGEERMDSKEERNREKTQISNTGFNNKKKNYFTWSIVIFSEYDRI